MSQTKVAVIGWSGYSGLELVKLILAHPKMQLSACFGRSDDKTHNSQKLNDFIPAAKDVATYGLDQLSERAAEFDTVFLATPIEVSKDCVSKLRNSSINIIDLSGAFRLDAGVCYGLQPWQQETSSLIANPGCYVTSILMALLPLLKEKLIDSSSLVIDAKSGTTGAGKNPTESLMFTEVEGNCLPYKVGEHQHLPEIIRHIENFSGVRTRPFFTAHLMPFKRGILSSIYAKTTATLAQIQEVFSENYKSYALLTSAPLKDGNKLMKLQNVVGTARTHISFEVVGDQLFLFSCIDNLLKGAASQAIENWNVLHGLNPSYFLEELT